MRRGIFFESTCPLRIFVACLGLGTSSKKTVTIASQPLHRKRKKLDISPFLSCQRKIILVLGYIKVSNFCNFCDFEIAISSIFSGLLLDLSVLQRKHDVKKGEIDSSSTFS